MNTKGTAREGQEFQAMMQAMANTQQKILKSWFDVARNLNDPLNHFSGVNGQCGDFKLPFFDAWAAETDHVITDVTQHLRNAQNTVVRFLEVSTRAWQAMAPRIEAGEDGHTVLREYLDWFRQSVTEAPERTVKAAQESAELWQLYVQQFQKLSQPCVDSLHNVPLHVGKTATGDGSAMTHVSNLCWDAYEHTFGRLIDSPGLGHTREFNDKLLKGFVTFVDARRASVDYQMMLSNAFTGAFEQLMEKVASLKEQGQPLQGLRPVLNLWFEVIDEVFSNVSRSDEYLQLQGRMVNTAMAHKLRERDVVEALLKTSHLPSRSEVDEAYRRIYELRKEVKALKKALQPKPSSPSVPHANIGSDAARPPRKTQAAGTGNTPPKGATAERNSKGKSR